MPSRPRGGPQFGNGDEGTYEEPWWEDTSTDSTTVPDAIDNTYDPSTGMGHPDSGGDEGTPGDDTYPDPGGGGGGNQWSWDRWMNPSGDWMPFTDPSVQGFREWWDAGEPTHLNFDWESGQRQHGGDWWPAPNDWSDHINTIRDTGEGARTFGEFNPNASIPSSAYSWKTDDTRASEANYDDMYNSLMDYRNQFTRNSTGRGQDPWSMTGALAQGANITDYENEWNQNQENFRIAADQAYNQWLAAQGKPPENGGNGTPTDQELCAQKAGWHWDGSTCVQDEVKPPDNGGGTPYNAEADCIAKGGVWTGTACDLRGTQYNPTTGQFDPDTTSTDISTDIDIPYTGEIPEDVTTTDYPYTTPQMQTIGNIQVGDDPVSEISNAALATMMMSGGMPRTPFNEGTMDALSQIIGAGGGGGAAETPFGEGIQSELQNLIDNRGQLEADPQRRAMEFEQLRSPIDAMRRAQTAQGQQAMASRNILGSGAEVDFLERLEGSLAPAYASAGQQLALSQQQAADTRYMDALSAGQDLATAQADRREARLLPALSLATGMAEASARNMLDSVSTWNERQQMLSDVVLRNLDQNMDWSKFIANFGLNRDQVIDMITTGRLDALANALNTNLSALQTISQGFVPYGDQ